MLASSDDGKTLWIGLNGAPLVVPVDTEARSAGAPIALGHDEWNGERYAGEVEAVPGSSTSFGVSGYFKWTTARPGIAIFDAGVRRLPILSTIDLLRTSQDVDAFVFDGPNVIYGAGNGRFVTMHLGTADLTTQSALPNLLPTLGGSVRLAGNKVVGSVGFVVDPVQGTQLGMIPWSGLQVLGPSPFFAVSGDGSHVYRATSGSVPYSYRIDCFDLGTLTRSGSVTFEAPGFASVPLQVVLYGATGAAVRFPGALAVLPDALRTPGCEP